MKESADACKIRNMCAKDLDEVQVIEKNSFVDPWSKYSMETMLDGNAQAFCIVGTIDEEVVGYAFTWIVVDEMHIGNIAVRSDFQNKGIGGKLMEVLFENARGHGCKVCWLEVRPSNQAARKLYDKLGFIQIAVRKKYYSDNGEDALILAKYF